ALHEGLLPQAREELTREKRIGLEDRRSVLLEWLLSNFTHREFHPSWNYLRVLDAPNAETIRRPSWKPPSSKSGGFCVLPPPSRGSDAERSATAADILDVRVVQLKARLHQCLGVVELGAVKIEIALAVGDHGHPVSLEGAVAWPRLIDVELVLKPGAAAADHFHAEHLA